MNSINSANPVAGRRSEWLVQDTKDLIAGGVWARSTNADRETIEDTGGARADGLAGCLRTNRFSGKQPERTVFNELEHEHTSALIDIAATGVPAWDTAIDYTPASDAACFVTTATGLHLTLTNTGPTYGNATDPDASWADALEIVLMPKRKRCLFFFNMRCNHPHCLAR